MASQSSSKGSKKYGRSKRAKDMATSNFAKGTISGEKYFEKKGLSTHKPK